MMIVARAQMEPDPEKAFPDARQSGNKILVVFSGSDWCLPCIHFEKTVLSDSAFRQFARPRLVIIEADFPQRKKIPPAIRTQYQALADRFDTEGAFPKIVLLNPDKTLLAVFPYNGHESAEDFIGQLKKKL